MVTITVADDLNNELYDCVGFDVLIDVRSDGSRFYFLYGDCVRSCRHEHVVERVVLDGSRDEDLMVQRMLELRAELAKKAGEGVEMP
ncbi:MAG: hypothetical protein NC399_11185 [Muribaculum sp.]|nr:hypothetical protein [Muribaculum sp.]